MLIVMTGSQLFKVFQHHPSSVVDCVRGQGCDGGSTGWMGSWLDGHTHTGVIRAVSLWHPGAGMGTV